MKHSIRLKLFSIIAAFAFMFIFILGTLNMFFYENYYFHDREGTLTDIYSYVDKNYTDDINEISEWLEEQEITIGVRLTLIEASGNVKYDSMFREAKNVAVVDENLIIHNFPLDDVTITKENLESIAENGYTLTTMGTQSEYNKPGNGGYLCLIGSLNNSEELLIARIPLSYMAENTSFNMTFLFITGFITLGLCFVIAYFVAMQFTKPLIRMNEMATAMASLDFSHKYEGKANDEIGTLGHNINKLSSHLEKAISDLQKTNENLEHEVKEKERIDNMRQEFIVNVSHELKTPIALVQGYAEGLREGVIFSEDDRAFYCDTIVEEAQRMNSLVMQLLDLSKIELGHAILEKTTTPLKEICDAVVAKTTLLANEKQINITYDDTDYEIFADESMLYQIITNLLSNAIRYTPKNGKVLIYCNSNENNTTLFVENEGEAIAEKDLSLIFEKFYRTDKARTRESGGSGIGLSIVKAVATAHGGSCGVQNIPNGVKFWVEFPK